LRAGREVSGRRELEYKIRTGSGYVCVVSDISSVTIQKVGLFQESELDRVFERKEITIILAASAGKELGKTSVRDWGT
jgi:hypothetical protein